MRILILTGIFPPDIGGPAMYTQKLAEELMKRGVRVKIITYSENRILNSKIQIIKISKKYPKGLRHFFYFLAVLKLARNCDLIFAQNLFSTGIPGLMASKLLRKKFIVKVVGDYAWEQSLMRCWFSEGIDEFQRVTSFKINLLKKIQRILASSVDILITPSHYLENIIIGWGVSPKKIKVIYNAVGELPKLNISKEEAKEKIAIRGDIILSIGRLASWKGFVSLIAVMPDLLKENPNFRLVIVGEGKEISHLKSQILNLNLNNKVYLAGKVSHSEISLYFKAADVFVLNSGYEGLSHVILEAMQLGVPVIASNCGGNPELTQDGFNGLLVEYNNRDQLKRSILKLWQNKELQNKFVKNSYEKLKQFSWENLVNKTLKVLSL